MLLLGGARTAIGWSVAATDRPTVAYVLMAVDMSVGMVIIMRWRRHSWGQTAEMCAAMFAPLPIFPLFAGSSGDHGPMIAAHILMLALMLALVVWRRDTYTTHHRAAVVRPDEGRPSERIG
jgi:hypothetical protein